MAEGAGTFEVERAGCGRFGATGDADEEAALLGVGGGEPPLEDGKAASAACGKVKGVGAGATTLSAGGAALATPGEGWRAIT